MKYQITALEGPVGYGLGTPPKMVPAEIEAFSFKINDQGTVTFVDRHGASIASFKHWLSILPVVESATIERQSAGGTVINEYPRAAGGFAQAVAESVAAQRTPLR